MGTRAKKDSDKPYVENYPELHAWLRKNEARCDWQLPLGDADDPQAYVEQWAIGGRAVLVTIRSRKMGWDIFTSGNDGRVIDTLEDADRRLARRPEKRTENEHQFAEVMAHIAQGAINIDSGLTEIQKTSLVHRAMHRLCALVTEGIVGVVR